MTRHEMLISILQMMLQLAIMAGRFAETDEGKQHARQLENALDHFLSDEVPPQV